MKDVAVVTRVEKLVGEALRRSGYSGVNARIVVGVSGGPDSCALLYALHRLSGAHKLELHAAHLNHDFRGEEAEEDARFVASKASSLGLPVTIEKQDPLEYQGERRISSFEQAAREMRYRFLAEVAHGIGSGAVAVGHTADDLAETVLEHILRGSGLSGLRGMTELSSWPWPTDVKDVTLFRPLLRATKGEAADYCRELGEEFREDSGNWLPQFTRNRVRHQLLPLLADEYNPKIREALVRLAGSASVELDYLEQQAEQVWPQVVWPEAAAGPGTVQFHRQALASLHSALQLRLLRRAYALLAGDTRRLRESHLTAMAALVQARGSGRTVALPGGLKFHETRDRLIMSPDSQPPCPFPPLEEEPYMDLLPSGGQPNSVEIGGWRVTARVVPAQTSAAIEDQDAYTARFDAGALGKKVRVRGRRPGDRFQPLGMAGEKKLQDFFTDAHVPRTWRDRVPLLVADGGIAWVVGYRIAQWARVRPDHRGDSPVLRVSFERM